MAVEAASAAGEGTDKLERWNYSLVLSSGVASATASQLVNPTLVLPFLYLALGAPVVVAGLLLPVMKGAGLVAEVVVAPLLNKTSRAKISVFLPTLVSALALSVIALTVDGAPPAVVVAVFMAITIVLGLCTGITAVGFGQLFGTVIPPHRRVGVAFNKALVAGILAIAVVAITKDFLAAEAPLQRHVTVLWAGIVATAVGGLMIIGVRLIAEEEKEEQGAEGENPASDHAKVRRHAHTLAGLRKGVEAGTQLVWFRRYLTARILFMSVTLALPFYTIHAASVHKGTPHGLTILVISASGGVAVGSLAWRRLSRHSHKLVMLASTLVGIASAVLALALDFSGLIENISLYAVAIFLVALAGGGVQSSGYLYFIDMTSKRERPYLLALGDVIVGVLAIGAASLLGVLAHLTDPKFPVMALLSLNLVAILAALALVDPATRDALEAPDDDHHYHLHDLNRL
jgi:hypothetical protein